MILVMLFIYSVLFGVLAASACKEGWRKYYIPAKVANSLAFVVIFFVAGYVSGDVVQFWLMLPAFFCCFVGDILLAEYNCYHKRIYFLLGLGIFLVGHICFVRWLCKLQQLSVPDVVLPAAAVLVTLGLTALKGMHTGKLRPAILCYSFFVAFFFVKGAHLALVQPSASSLVIASGSTLFFASDILILFLYFYKEKKNSVHIFNLATYYYGMFLLAVNLLI